MLNSKERAYMVLAGLTIGSMSAVLVYYFPWRAPVSPLAVLAIGWAMCAMGQVLVTGLYRRHSEHMTALWLDLCEEHRQTMEFNRYLWGEMNAITNRNSDPPGFAAGEVVPPEGSAGGSLMAKRPG